MQTVCKGLYEVKFCKKLPRTAVEYKQKPNLPPLLRIGWRGNTDDPFADAMSHYNPDGCAHPHHAGDLPPLFENGGLALSLFLTNRFSADEVIGRTVIIHDRPDDFTTQPSGNSGTKIACGVIRRAVNACR